MSNRDLHGQAPESAPAALLLIDVINDLEFDGGDRLLPAALQAADRIAALKDAARAKRLPTIYVNDNFGRWQSNFDALIENYLESDVRGAPIVRKLAPSAKDYHVLKPQQSGFFATPLAVLLRYLQVDDLILAGFTTDRCVMFTAMDAYTRGFGIRVPSDCSAAIEQSHHEQSLAYMQRVLKAEVRPGMEILR
ncbi:MAG: cysteine hydrolase [Gammaproteobacteria bacterium]|nr:cysteine hydrolase [Gammaproteobacteria bacterium]